MVGSDSTCTRILTALEDLVAQESAVLQVGDYAALESIQVQAGPLVIFLASQPEAAFAAGLEGRILALQAARNRNATRLNQEMARNRDELRVLSGRQGLVARVAPAYGANLGSSRQLSFVA